MDKNASGKLTKSGNTKVSMESLINDYFQFCWISFTYGGWKMH